MKNDKLLRLDTRLLPPCSRRCALATLALPAVAAWLAGCAAAPTAPRDERAALLERARAYWQAVRDGDWVAAWPYEAISRDPNWSLQSYLRRVGGIQFHAVQVLGVKQLEADRAIVEVDQKFDVPLARLRGMSATILDHWIRIDGLWYHDRERRASEGS